MSRKFSTLMFAAVLGVGVLSFSGCGPKVPDTTGVKGANSPEETTKQIEDAMKSGKIDPKTYGKNN